VKDAEPTVEFEDGDCLNVRYLHNPKNGNMVAIQDLADSDSIPTEQVNFWERRLGLTIL
jgi:hypothetical protein